ncbi:MAG: hypothetical protein ACRC30_06130 [Clostridium sp.]
MKAWKIASVIGVIVLIILVVVPRSYFVKSEVINKTNTNIALTNGPKEMNEFMLNVIKIQAISGDMGNTIEYTLKDIVTENEASDVLTSDFNDLQEIKENVIALGDEYPEELGKNINIVITNIDKLQNIAKDTIPYIQNYNEEKLKGLSTEISYCFNKSVSKIGKYTVNQEAYNNELANMTYKYNKAKEYVS